MRLVGPEAQGPAYLLVLWASPQFMFILFAVSHPPRSL